jgi:fumarylacetoacetate (FAA) hydrolase
MKLATLNDGSRDGQLVVVARDLGSAHHTSGIAGTLQQVLDDWNFISPQLEDLYATLNGGKARHAFPFDPRACMAPLPRAYRWVEAQAYFPHLERVYRAQGTEVPAAADLEPPLAPGASDDFLGPCDDAPFASADGGIDFGAGLAVVTGDVAAGAAPEAALEAVRLLLLVNGWSLRRAAAADPPRGCGCPHGRAATALGPLAVTPDELGMAWRGGRIHLPVYSARNGVPIGRCEAGPEMSCHFGQLIAQLARARRVRAGTIVGSGTVSNADPAQGACCIAERRALELLDSGTPQTAYLQSGETIRIEMRGRDGQSVFGAIEQRVTPWPA